MLVSHPALPRIIDVASFVARGFSVVETEAPLRRGQRGSDGGSPQGALCTMGNVMSRRVKSQ